MKLLEKTLISSIQSKIETGSDASQLTGGSKNCDPFITVTTPDNIQLVIISKLL